MTSMSQDRRAEQPATASLTVISTARGLPSTHCAHNHCVMLSLALILQESLIL
jgi:hypothetical protein